MRVRVTFLYVVEGPRCGEKVDVVVDVPHPTRAESFARATGHYPTHMWHLYGTAEIHE